jgi:hypothetical protein
MAEDEKKDYSYYIDKAKKVHDETDLEKRVEKIMELAREYQSSSLVHSGMQTAAHTQLDFANIGKLATKIHNEQLKKGKTLNRDETDGFMKEAVTEILVGLGYGNKENPDHNLSTFEAYCATLGKDGQKNLETVRSYISHGDGRRAMNIIIDTMMAHRELKANTNFFKYLFPDDHHKLREKTSEYIAKKTTDAMKGRDPVNPGLVQSDIDKVFLQYIGGNLDEIVNAYSAKDKTPESK